MTPSNGLDSPMAPSSGPYTAPGVTPAPSDRPATPENVSSPGAHPGDDQDTERHISMSDVVHITHYADENCIKALIDREHRCRRRDGRILRSADDGVCYIGALIDERLGAYAERMAAPLIAVARAEDDWRHEADVANARLRTLVEHTLPLIDRVNPDAAHALEQALNTADHASLLAEWQPTVA